MDPPTYLGGPKSKISLSRANLVVIRQQESVRGDAEYLKCLRKRHDSTMLTRTKSSLPGNSVRLLRRVLKAHNSYSSPCHHFNKMNRLSTIGALDAIVIGAGAAGLTASYELIRRGLKIKLLEASNRIGGRMRKTDTFTDFPLDLGGAWIHVDPAVLDDIVNDPNVPVNKSNIVPYKPKYRYYWGPEKSWYSEKYEGSHDHTFVGSTWYDFFNTFIAPSSAHVLELNWIVDRIDSSSDQFIKVISKDGRVFLAKKVIVTVPLEVLKRADITFIPQLPNEKQRAIQKVKFDAGLKAFFKFSTKFYSPAFDAYFQQKEDKVDGDRFFFDASHGQTTKDHVLGVFIRGHQASSYVNLDDEGIKKKILAELDVMYDGKANEFYLHHIITNWTQEPFIGGIYSNHESCGTYKEIQKIAKPIAMGRIHFAGEALEPDGEYGHVHGAALTGQNAARKILSPNPQCD